MSTRGSQFLLYDPILTSPFPVSFVSKGTIEEDILERARRKMILEYAIINQMDTTGTNVGAKSGTSKPSEGFSKDELAQILKFGAQSM